jgi:integrase
LISVNHAVIQLRSGYARQGPPPWSHSAARRLVSGAGLFWHRPRHRQAELPERVDPGRKAGAKDSASPRRLVAEVEAQRVARTKATFGTAIDAWLKIHEVEANPLRGYEANARRYIKPALGDVALSKVTAQVLEVFYAELRRCRARCGGRPMIDHRVDGEHECAVIRHRNPVGRPPKGGHQNHDCTKMRCEVVGCQPHRCKPLAASTIRDIHFTISAILAAAVRWEWIKSNPATVARKPRKPAPEPQPPTPEQAAQIVDAAWQQDEDWGTFVWLTMVTGMRRAELLGLRWHNLQLERAVLEIRRNYVWVNGRAVEKDTKTHRMRRIALDSDTVELTQRALGELKRRRDNERRRADDEARNRELTDWHHRDRGAERATRHDDGRALDRG